MEQPGSNRQHRKEEPAGYGDQTSAWARAGIPLGSETPALGCFSGELENFLCVNEICLVEKDITIRESCFFQPTEPKVSQQLKEKKGRKKDGNYEKLYTFLNVNFYLCYIFDRKLQ